MKMQPFPSTLYIDQSVGHVTTMGNDELYTELLERYYATQSHFFQQYEEALAQNDRASALRSVHSLKGLSGNIGAKHVEKIASKLEYALQQNEEATLETLKRQTFQELGFALGEIEHLRKYFTHRPFAVLKEDTKKVHELYALLKVKLREYDATASDTLKELLEYRSQDSQKIDELSALILNYQFEEALEKLEQIVGEKH